jgi:nitrite reductase (NADH) large subunit
MSTFHGKILIIGASAAGIQAAKDIRKHNRDAEVTIVTEESHYPYYRPFLTEYIGDPTVMAKPNFYLNPETWYHENGIQLILNEKVTGITPAAKTVKTAHGREFPYDKLILANGSKPFVPVKGLLEKENVFAIRTFDDAKAVEQYANTVKRATVIGGGLLGIEAAYSLLKKNLHVIVIEFVNRILPMQLDEEGSKLFQTIMTKHGVELQLGALAESFTGQQKVSAIRLKSGQEIPTEMVIFSIGVRANLDLAVTCGLKINRGIVVNERMETSLPDIYACGDVAEFGTCAALWTVALEQGKVAGLNVIGEPAAFKAENYPFRLQSFDTKLYSIGDIGRDDAFKNYMTMRREIPEEYIYKQLYFKGNKLTGGILIGDIKRSGALSKTVNKTLTIEETITLLD